MAGFCRQTIFCGNSARMLELGRRKMYKEGKWRPTKAGKFANQANSRGRARVRSLAHGTTPPSRDRPRGSGSASSARGRQPAEVH